MKNRLTLPAVAGALLLVLAWVLPGPSEEPSVAFPRFRMQEIGTDLKVGYAVLLVDLNGDGKKDIVVVDTRRVIWYENPAH